MGLDIKLTLTGGDAQTIVNKVCNYINGLSSGTEINLSADIKNLDKDIATVSFNGITSGKFLIQDTEHTVAAEDSTYVQRVNRVDIDGNYKMYGWLKNDLKKEILNVNN
jgi:hypothetical protein